MKAENSDILRGIEGEAAAVYFSVFDDKEMHLLF